MKPHRLTLLTLALFAGLAPLQSADAAFIRRNMIKQSPVEGYRVMVVVADDSSDEVHQVQVALSGADEGAPAPDTEVLVLRARRPIKPNGNKRYVFSDVSFSGDPTGSSYRMQITLLDAEGVALGAPETRWAVVDGALVPSAGPLTIQATDRENFDLELGVYGDPESQVATASLSFLEGSGTPPLQEELTLRGGAPDGGRRSFRATGLSFADPSAAVDEAYEVLVDLRDAEGFSLRTEEATVVVKGMAVR